MSHLYKTHLSLYQQYGSPAGRNVQCGYFEHLRQESGQKPTETEGTRNVIAASGLGTDPGFLSWWRTRLKQCVSVHQFDQRAGEQGKVGTPGTSYCFKPSGSLK